MNYEEMLNAQDGVAVHREQMPLGAFYRKQIDRKYRYVVDFRPELADSLLFCEGLRHDQQTAKDISDSHQLRYELHEDSGGVYEIELQPGSYQTMAQLLEAQPSVLAQKSFVSNTIDALMALTEQLHERGVYHLCYSLSNIYVRKGENEPLLLCHGSSFIGLKDQSLLYKGFEQDVAPEVLESGKADERSDVFGLGRFIEHLMERSGQVSEYKSVVKKATGTDPDSRYSTISAMRSAISSRRNTRRSMWLALAACAVVALLVGVFFSLIREPSTVEFIDDNGVKAKSDPFEEVFDDEYVDDQEPYVDPEIVGYMDSIAPMTDEEVKQLSDSIRVNDQLNSIFRRRFEQKVRTQLSPLYGTEESGMNENDYVAKSEQVMKELYNYASQLSQETGVNIDDANSMATQIISHVQAELMENVKHTGVILKAEE